MTEVALLVGEQEAPDIYKLSEEVDLEVGPFTVSTRLTLQASAGVLLLQRGCTRHIVGCGMPYVIKGC